MTGYQELEMAQVHPGWQLHPDSAHHQWQLHHSHSGTSMCCPPSHRLSVINHTKTVSMKMQKSGFVILNVSWDPDYTDCLFDLKLYVPPALTKNVLVFMSVQILHGLAYTTVISCLNYWKSSKLNGHMAWEILTFQLLSVFINSLAWGR